MAKIALLQAKLTLPKRRIDIISDIHGDARKLRHFANNASSDLSNLVNSAPSTTSSKATGPAPSPKPPSKGAPNLLTSKESS